MSGPLFSVRSPHLLYACRGRDMILSRFMSTIGVGAFLFLSCTPVVTVNPDSQIYARGPGRRNATTLYYSKASGISAVTVRSGG